MAAARSPRSRQRLNVVGAYRARGHANGNLWVVYSPKTNGDFVLASDRALIHWACCLEGDAQVAHYESADCTSAGPGVGSGAPAWRVRYRNGHLERHRVGRAADGAVLSDQAGSGQPAEGAARVFGEDDLRALATQANAWLKVIAHAAVLRDSKQRPVTHALGALLRGQRQGSVGAVLAALSVFDAPLVLAVLCRLALQGQCRLEAQVSGLTLGTRWTWTAP